jgi:hypothetical protein
MSRWRQATAFNGIRLFQLITWGIALIIITACGHSGTVHFQPSPVPNQSPVAVSHQ